MTHKKRKNKFSLWKHKVLHLKEAFTQPFLFTRKKHEIEKAGFTLMELIIASAILLIVLVGLIATFIGCFTVTERARNLSVAMNGCREKMEEIRNLRDAGTPRAAGHYTDDLSNFAAGHKVSIDIFDDGSDPDGISSERLFWIKISVSWMQKGGRIIGEDNGSGGGAALNGILDGTEDTNGDGLLDSPAQIVTLLIDNNE